MDRKQQEELDKELIAAAGNNNVESVKQLLDAGADIDSRSNMVGWAPLYIAALNGSSECVSQLIAAGADLDIQDNDGYTPLHAAAYRGQINCMKLLIEAGADVNIKNNFGRDPSGVLKEEHLKLYKKHIDGLMAFRPAAKHLVSEDNIDPVSTGFEYDM